MSDEKHISEIAETIESAAEPTVQERLDAIRQRVEKATEGPWRNEPGSTKMGYPADESETRSIECKAGYPVAGTTIYKTLNDAEFIANARQDIPFLLSLLDRLEAIPDGYRTREGGLPGCRADHRVCQGRGEVHGSQRLGSAQQVLR